MSRTPGFIVPSAYSSNVELEQDLRERSKAAEFTPFEASSFLDEDTIEHYGIKGMKWGVHKKGVGETAKLVGTAQKLRKDPTKAAAQSKAKEAGGLHKLNDKELQAVLNRMEMERKYKNFMAEDAKRRSEGAKAVGKILLEVGKVALPLAVGFAANRAYNNSTFRTSSIVSRTMIDGVAKSTALVRR